MKNLAKGLIVIAAILFAATFKPSSDMRASIFEGSTDITSGQAYGICINNPGSPECQGVDCSLPNTTDIRCISETEAGTGLAKEELSTTGITHTEKLSDLIIKYVNFVLPYLALAAFVGYVVAGFLYVTAMGSDENIKKAKSILIWSTVGLILVIASYAIVQFFTSGLLGKL